MGTGKKGRGLSWSFIDPESQRNGDVLPASDAYSFGMVMLDVMTGRRREVLDGLEDVVDGENGEAVVKMLDGSAGVWPADLAPDMAKIALKCYDFKRKARPGLDEVLDVLQKAQEQALAAEKEEEERKVGVKQEALKYFLCPITEVRFVLLVTCHAGMW